MAHTKEQLIEYIERQEARLKNTASKWMKSEVKKGIDLAKKELAKLEANNG